MPTLQIMWITLIQHFRRHMFLYGAPFITVSVLPKTVNLSLTLWSLLVAAFEKPSLWEEALNHVEIPAVHPPSHASHRTPQWEHCTKIKHLSIKSQIFKSANQHSAAVPVTSLNIIQISTKFDEIFYLSPALILKCSAWNMESMLHTRDSVCAKPTCYKYNQLKNNQITSSNSYYSHNEELSYWLWTMLYLQLCGICAWVSPLIVQAGQSVEGLMLWDLAGWRCHW